MPTPLRVVVMGVAGSGKTTIGHTLAERLGCHYVEADEAHPPANIAKMSAGIPLTDTDRAPWLDRLADELSHSDRVVITCSALKRSYRDRLRAADDVRFLHLAVTADTALARLHSRTDHFMGPEMLTSQFDALEPPADDESDVTTIDGSLPVHEIVERAAAALTDPTPPP